MQILNKEKNIYYLDFDGVIADSATECINTSFLAWLKIVDDKKRGLVDSKKLIIEYALNFRYLVTPPENYYCLIDLLVDTVSQANGKINYLQFEDSFKNKVDSENIETLNKFKEIFFQTRKERFSKKPKSEWLDENPPTKFLKKFKELTKNHNCQVKIVSRKDKESIIVWLDQTKLNINEIYGNESLENFNNSKFSLIRHLQHQNNLKSAIFIDDSPEEIYQEDWKSIFITPIIAGWGYNHFQDNTKQVLKKIKEDLR